MEPGHLTDLVKKYVKSEFAKLKSKNHLTVECISSGKPWLSDVNHWNFVAGAKAMEKVWHVKPDYTREGGSIPVTLTFQNVLKKNVLLLPIGACDDGAHSTNEKIDRKNFIEGIKVLASYLHQLSIVKRK